MDKPRYEDFVTASRNQLAGTDYKSDNYMPALKAICFALLSIGAAIKEASKKKKPTNQETS